MSSADRDLELFYEWLTIHNRLAAEGLGGDELEQATADEFLAEHSIDDFQMVLDLRSGLMDGYREGLRLLHERRGNGRGMLH